MAVQKKKTTAEEVVVRTSEYKDFTLNCTVKITGGYWATAKWPKHWIFKSYCTNPATDDEWIEIYNTRLAKNIAISLDNVEAVPVKSKRKRRTTREEV